MAQIPIPGPNVTRESSSNSESSDMTDTMLLTQADFNDLTQDLNLCKESTQLLGSHLWEKRLLAPGTTFYWYWEREKEFRYSFTFNQVFSLVYCNNIADLI